MKLTKSLLISIVVFCFINLAFSQEYTEIVLSGDQIELIAEGGTSPYQWQESSDNVSWTNIVGETDSTYSFVATGTSGSEKYYRAGIENTGCGAPEMFYSPVIHYIYIEDLSELNPGDAFRGGIAYNYDGAEKRIASAQDDTTGIHWACLGLDIFTNYEDGQMNTANILTDCTDRPIAASVCDESSLNNYEDWYLPADQELYRLNQAKELVGGFSDTLYWTSTEEAAGNDYKAWAWSFSSNMNYGQHRTNEYPVRCIRPVLASDTTRTTVTFAEMPSLASITSQPASITVCSTAPAILSVTAEGQEPISYQWYKDSEVLTGFTENTINITETDLSDEGIYYCEITNACGTVNSDNAEIKVIQLSVNAGDDDEFCNGTAYNINASADSNYPTESGVLEYSWTPAEGLDETDILNPTAQPIESTTYTLNVTDELGCSAFDSFLLTLLDPVIIETQPISQQACAGEEISFTLNANGTEPLSYQWLKDGDVIADATESTLTLPTITNEDAGIYTCEVSNTCGAITSDEAILELYSALNIITNPASQNICHDAELTLSVDVSGEEPINFQWKIDNQIIDDAQNDTLIIDNALLVNEGIYTCEISNICGSLTSDEADIKIIQIILDAGSDEEICPGSDVQLEASAESNHPETSGDLIWLWEPSTGLSDTAIYNPTANPESDTEYTVSATDQLGCSNEDSLIVSLQTPFDNEQICMVSVDTLTSQTKILWEKTPGEGSSAFNIYKYTESESWEIIGTIPFDEPAEFIDNSSQPNEFIERYKIAVMDSCGNESVKSYYHSPIFLQITESGSTMELNWDSYEDESGDFIPEKYYIYRSNTSSDIQLLDSVLGNTNTYNDNDVNTHYNYWVSTKKQSGCGNTDVPFISFSNRVENSITTSISESQFLSQDKLIVFPNPFTKQATIRFNNENNQVFSFRLTDNTGRTVMFMQNIRDNEVIIKRSGLKTGMYLIELQSANRVIRGKIMLE
ncbi:MAG: immunoglobulin domain-containing protein [Bacteroidales bacterium]|jgi:hypothetical protein|nr:immunoglobulin domain-containing protein [Bacteroidales bacterium]